jgi:hypothetical protein
LIKEASFVICFIRPQSQLFANGPTLLTMTEIVTSLGHYLEEIKNALSIINPQIELIIETGWPSEGNSPNGSPNSLVNLLEYWVGMSEWAISKGMRIFLFEALDEPWKKDLTITHKNESNGLCGSEDRYGWWKRKDNSNDSDVYIRKVDVLKELDSANLTENQNSIIGWYFV